MARDFLAQKGAILQEYLMYFKKLQRICGGKDQPDTEDVFNQWFLKSGHSPAVTTRVVPQRFAPLSLMGDKGVFVLESLMKDILFKTDEFVFSYRIQGVLVRNGKALLQRSGEDYALIGGHVVAFETTKDTLIREFKEEIHADIAVGELIGVGEVFFPWGNKPCHQIGLYYVVHLRDESQIPLDGIFHGYDELGSERTDLDFCWVPLNELQNITLYPPQMVSHILSGSKDVLHFVYKE